MPVIITKGSDMMLIGKNWKIESDALNVILSKRHIAQTGKNKGQEVWTPEGYYHYIPDALESLVEHGVRESELKDLKTVVAKIEELKREIREALANQREKE